MRIRLPSGTIGYAAAAASSPSSGTAYEPTNVVGTALVAGDNVLAVELHQFIPFSSDAVFWNELAGLLFSFGAAHHPVSTCVQGCE